MPTRATLACLEIASAPQRLASPGGHCAAHAALYVRRGAAQCGRKRWERSIKLSCVVSAGCMSCLPAAGRVTVRHPRME